jgi:membrane-bound metal-dependent hydrolase YbcI (DUF457 family)
MDIIAHSLSGVLLGRIAAPDDSRKERIYYLGISIAALVLPDADAISYLWGPDAFAAIHQRYTHTIFSMIFFPPAVAGLVYLFHKKHTFIRTYLLFLCGMIIHIAEDLIAHWPVQFFYPLSQKGWALGLINKDFSLVVDFIIIIGAMLTFYDGLLKYRHHVGIGTFIVLILYLLFGPGY